MKKVLLTAVAVFAFGFANAQEEAKTFGFAKGDKFVEGNLGFYSSKDTDSDEFGDYEERKYSEFNFNPKAGYFVTEKLAVGLELDFSSSKSVNTDLTTSPNSEIETKGNNFGVGVFARYYFLDLGQRFKTYAEAGFGFNSGKEERTQTGIPGLTRDNKISGVGAGVSLGMQYFITPKMAINFGLADVLSFASSKSENKLSSDETKSTELNGNFNVFNNFFDTARFGLTYKF